MIRCTFLPLLLILPIQLLAHGGGLDSYGCHNETATGMYHCHQGDYAGLTFNDKDTALDFFTSQEITPTPRLSLLDGDQVIPDTDGSAGEQVILMGEFDERDNSYHTRWTINNKPATFDAGGPHIVALPDGETEITFTERQDDGTKIEMTIKVIVLRPAISSTLLDQFTPHATPYNSSLLTAYARVRGYPTAQTISVGKDGVLRGIELGIFNHCLEYRISVGACPPIKMDIVSLKDGVPQGFESDPLISVELDPHRFLSGSTLPANTRYPYFDLSAFDITVQKGELLGVILTDTLVEEPTWNQGYNKVWLSVVDTAYPGGEGYIRRNTPIFDCIAANEWTFNASVEAETCRRFNYSDKDFKLYVGAPQEGNAPPAVQIFEGDRDISDEERLIILDSDHLTQETVNLSAIVSDIDGQIVLAEWHISNSKVAYERVATGLNTTLTLPDGDTAVSFIATDDSGNFTYKSFLITIKPPNQLPVVSIAGGDRTIPDSGAPQELVNFVATATDSDGTIISTEWVINGVVLDTGLTASFYMGDGQYEVTFRATDDDGATSSASVIITVEPPTVNIPPIVSIIGGNRVIEDSDGTAGETVSFSATATDNDGTIASSEWLINSAVVATGLTPNIPLTDGATIVTFRATDDDGAATSTNVTITVVPPNQPPVVAIAGGDRTIPDSDGIAGETVTFSATATDNDGSIASVEWLVNGTQQLLPEPALEYYQDNHIDDIVHSRCVFCHEENGLAGNTGLLFERSGAGSVDHNFSVFKSFIQVMQNSADYVLNKTNGEIAHVGGINLIQGSEEHEKTRSFLQLLSIPAPINQEATFKLSAGENIVAFRATDDDGASSSTNVTITVEPLPANESPTISLDGGNRTIGDTDGLPGELVLISVSAFDSDGTLNELGYEIEFGDGTYIEDEGSPLPGDSSEFTVSAEIVLPDGVNEIVIWVVDDDGFPRHAQVTITVEAPPDPYAYNRDDYLTSWRDNDGDCINTRHEVLAIESLVEPTFDESGCQVIEGLWYDPYTDESFTDPSDLDIDHLVPLKEAHDSGAKYWSEEEKRAFANDTVTADALIAVDASANRSKGADDPALWLPPNQEYHCEYVRDWVAVKNAYDLEFDEDEVIAIEDILGDEIHHATGLTQNGINLSGQGTSARFSLGMNRNGSCGFYTDGAAQDWLKIVLSITPDAEHAGRTTGIYILFLLGEQLHVINSSGQAVPIDVDPNQLEEFTNLELNETFEFTLFEGYLGAPLDVQFYLAYWPEGGELIYTPVPITLTIN